MLTKLKLANPVARLKKKRSVWTMRTCIGDINKAAWRPEESPPWHPMHYVNLANELGYTLYLTERRSRPHKPIQVRQ